LRATKKILEVWKLGIVTDEISQDFEHAVKVASELGVQYVEIRNLWNKNVVYLSDSEFSEMRNIVRKYGLQISNISSPAFKIYIGDESKFKEHLKILKRAIELTKSLDLHFTRVFTFWFEGTLDRYIDKLMERFRAAIDIASDEGVYLAIENEYSCIVGTGVEARRFLDKLNSRWVKVLWDPGNAFFAREDPYPTGFKAVKDFIIHVHLKDAAVDDNGHFVWRPIGGGSINFRDMFKEMKGANYVLSLETHYRPPSGDRETGTRESFAGLISILSEIT